MNELKEDLTTINKGLKSLQRNNKPFKKILRGVCFGMCGASDITGYNGQFNQTANTARNNFTNKFQHVDNKQDAVQLLNNTKMLLNFK